MVLVQVVGRGVPATGSPSTTVFRLTYPYPQAPLTTVGILYSHLRVGLGIALQYYTGLRVRIHRGIWGIGDTKACNTKHYQYRYYRYIRVIPLNTPTPIPEIPTSITGKFPCILLTRCIGVHTPLHPGTIGRYHPGVQGITATAGTRGYGCTRGIPVPVPPIPPIPVPTPTGATPLTSSTDILLV